MKQIGYFVLALFFGAHIDGCRKTNDVVESIIPDSAAGEKMADEQPMNEGIGDEDAQYDLPVDSMTVSYRSMTDKLIGFRDGDTLIVEGDMKYIYPRTGPKAVGKTNNLWPLGDKLVIIPYKINSAYEFPSKVRSAIEKWERSKSVKFIPKRVSDNDFIEFVPSDKFTRSFVGRIKGRQTIELQATAEVWNIAHEIGHAMGLFHEQTRSDRDQFVKIDCSDNINYKHAYKSDPYARDLGSYDFNSIMHYRPSNCMTVKNIILPAGIPGQRDSISRGDITGIRSIYQIK